MNDLQIGKLPHFYVTMGKDYLGEDQRRVREDKDEKEIKGFIHFNFYSLALDEGDIALLKTYVS